MDRETSYQNTFVYNAQSYTKIFIPHWATPATIPSIPQALNTAQRACGTFTPPSESPTGIHHEVLRDCDLDRVRPPIPPPPPMFCHSNEPVQL